MFDDQERVSQISQAVERLDETTIVAGVESDRRFVEDIENTAQAASELAGEPNALRFPVGESGSWTSQREIVESHINEELQSGTDFAQQIGGYLLRVTSEFPVLDRR